MRVATVIIAVLLTIYKDKFWKPVPSEAEDIQDAEERSTTEGKQMRLNPGAMC